MALLPPVNGAQELVLAQGSLTQYPQAFTLLLDRADAMGWDIERVQSDYCLHIGLRALAQAYPSDEVMHDPQTGLPFGSWAFADGTVLVSAHNIGQRYSDPVPR